MYSAAVQKVGRYCTGNGFHAEAYFNAEAPYIGINALGSSSLSVCRGSSLRVYETDI